LSQKKKPIGALQARGFCTEAFAPPPPPSRRPVSPPPAPRHRPDGPHGLEGGARHPRGRDPGVSCGRRRGATQMLLVRWRFREGKDPPHGFPFFIAVWMGVLFFASPPSPLLFCFPNFKQGSSAVAGIKRATICLTICKRGRRRAAYSGRGRRLCPVTIIPPPIKGGGMHPKEPFSSRAGG